jgi:tetratricopeptide (TPR) repeat protein
MWERPMSTGWKTIHIDDLDEIPVAGVVWRPVRRRLGITAFGINAYAAEKIGGNVIEEHDETSSGAGGHEEAYVVVRGRATFTVDDETQDAPAGTIVYVGDPGLKRSAVAEEEDTLVIAIGGAPGRAYEVSPWEHYFAAAPLLDAGRFEEGIAMIESGLRERPDNPSVLYNLACAESRGGRTADALAHLAQAVAINPKYVDYAKRDPDFEAIRGEPGFLS